MKLRLKCTSRLHLILLCSVLPLSVQAMSHPRCVGWGEMGLDYHYDLSPRDLQQSVFRRQLRLAVQLHKPLTIHTREADEDTERILKEEVPREHPVRSMSLFRSLTLFCCRRFTSTASPTRPSSLQISSLIFQTSTSESQVLLGPFCDPCCLLTNITGVITYTSNQCTSQVVRNLLASPSSAHSPLRILLETDAPYMAPANLYSSLPSTLDGESLKGRRLPLCHTAMIPWTAQFVANIVNEKNSESDVNQSENAPTAWTADMVMRIARDNARRVYGV